MRRQYVVLVPEIEATAVYDERWHVDTETGEVVVSQAITVGPDDIEVAEYDVEDRKFV